MCELLALSSSTPARLTFSLHTLAARGGPQGNTHDGWGVAFYQGRDAALFREPTAAGDSALVRFLETSGPATNLAISHIRHATRGSLALANTQPFARELGGRTHIFAHNGDLPGIYGSSALLLGNFRLVGESDSEHAFCALLARLSPLWMGVGVPSLQARLSVLADFSAELRALGPANFLYADGDTLFVHGHRRVQQASGRIEAPGLWRRQQHCTPADSAPTHRDGVSIAPARRSVIWVTSVPFADEGWLALGEGELLAVRNGSVLASGD